MGRMSIYQNYEDFILESKRIPIKEIYYEVGSQSSEVDALFNGAAIKATRHVSTLKLTACEDAKELKRYLVLNSKAGELIAHSQTNQEEIDAFGTTIRSAVEEMVKRIQKDYPSATLINGTTAPYQG